MGKEEKVNPASDKSTKIQPGNEQGRIQSDRSKTENDGTGGRTNI